MRSDAPRPIVVISLSVLTPWNPATTATLPSASAWRTRSPLTSMILALPWMVSVMMPTWLPVKLTAAMPRSARAIVSSAADTRSPVVSSMSISRPGPGARHLAGEGDQVVGRLAHRRDDDDDVVAVALRDLHVLGHGPHAIRVGDGRAAVLLDDQGHGGREPTGGSGGFPGRVRSRRAGHEPAVRSVVRRGDVALGDVLDDLEGEQVGAGRHRLAVGGLGLGVAVLERRAVDPRLERLLASQRV